MSAQPDLFGRVAPPCAVPLAARRRKVAEPPPDPAPYSEFVKELHERAFATLKAAIEGAIEELRNELPGLPDQETADEVGIHVDTLEEVISRALFRFELRGGGGIGSEDDL